MSCRIQPEELLKYNGDLTVDFFWGSIVSMLDELAGGDSARTESKMVSVSYHWCTQPLRSIQQNGLLLVPTGVEERLGPGLRKAVKRRLSKVFWQMAVKKKVSVVFCETGRHFFKIN